MGMGSSGGGGGAGTSQLIGSLNQLSAMGNDKSKLALNILNAVLSSDSAMGDSREVWEHGPPPRKMRRMEWDELRPPPARRYPPRFSPRRNWDRRGGPSYPRGEHHAATDYQARRVAKARRGKPWHDTRSGKGPGGRDGRAKEEQDLSDDPEREPTSTPAAGPSQAQAAQSEGAKEGEEAKEDASEPSTSGQHKKEEGKEDGKKEEEEEEEDEDSGKAKEKEKEEKKDKDTKVVHKINEAGEITWLPREALQCHMCGLSKFPDIKSYMRHLESRRHETLKYSFHAKGAAILHFLRANSKLASQRKMLKSMRRGIKGPIMRCRKCQCEVFGYIREHAKTVEHIALRNYLRVECCDTTFFNRAELEEHRLSLVHLKNQLEEEQSHQKDEKESEAADLGVEESEEGKLFADTIIHMKKKSQFAEVTSPENLTPYDPSIPQGLNFLWKRSHYRCKVCPETRLTSAPMTEEHFKSLEHYNNLLTHLKNVEEEKEKKRLEEEEAAKKAELEKKKKEEEEKQKEQEAKESAEGDGKEAQEGEEEMEEGEKTKEQEEEEEEEEEEEQGEDGKRNGDAEETEDTSFNFEDMHNMETVDEACDDGDLEGIAAEGDLAKGEEDDEDMGGVSDEELFADISCLAEVGEELDEDERAAEEEAKKAKSKADPEKGKAKKEEEEEKPKAKVEEEKVKGEAAAVATPATKKEASDSSPKKEPAVKREREEGTGTEVRGRGTPRATGTARGRRGRGRGRARSTRN